MKSVLDSVGTKPGKYLRIVTVPLKKGKLSIPVHVIRGKKAGPVLVAAGGEHGNELNGPAAIDRIFQEISSNQLKGTLVAIPIVNPRNVQGRGTNVYGGEWDTFRAWPGDPTGTPAERITAALAKAVMDDADAVINIHAWSWYSASCAFTSALNRQSARLARAFGLEFVMFEFTPYCEGRTAELHPKHNTLMHHMLAQGKPAMLVELRTQSWLFPDSVNAGMQGLRNVMISLGMIPGKPVLPPVQFEATKEEFTYAPCRGFYISLKEIADRVKKNETLGYLYDLETGKRTEVKSPCAGAIWLNSRVGRTVADLPGMHAYAEKGDMLALIKHIK